MEDHFDGSPNSKPISPRKNKTALLEITRAVSKLGPRHLHPPGRTPRPRPRRSSRPKRLIGDEPFACSPPRRHRRRALSLHESRWSKAFNDTQSTILASEVIEGPAISAYARPRCIPDPKNPRLLDVKNMSKNQSSKTLPFEWNAIIGRYILTPRIFDMLETITPRRGGELQLTDAIKALLQYEKGSTASTTKASATTPATNSGFLKATVELRLKRDDLGPAFRTWLKSFPL